MSAPRCGIGLLAALAAGVVTACHLGGNINEYPGMRSAAGAWCKIQLPQLPGGEFQGELLAVDSTSAAFLASPPRVWVLPYALMRGSDCGVAGQIPYEQGKLVEAQASQIRLMSRYPQGITPDLMTRLLAAYGQTAPLIPR